MKIPKAVLIAFCSLLNFGADAIAQDPTVESKKKMAAYDPLESANDTIATLELKVNDKDRSREVPVLVYLPKSAMPSAVIIHSHGLGGTRNTSTFLGKHWAARGYVAVFVQHPGSDDSVWKGAPLAKRMDSMTQAASAANLKLRTADVTAVIDQLEEWNVEDSHPLKDRMDLNRIGMSGHSFGAVTTQHIGGQSTFGRIANPDKRVIAAIPMSPSPPKVGNPDRAFGEVKIPWLCMTGTHDVAAIGGESVESRLTVYPALPKGDKYELVLNKAEHGAFTETSLPREKQKRNPNHHRAIMAITTAFWDSYLMQDATAKEWLTTESVRSVLESEDRWQKK